MGLLTMGTATTSSLSAMKISPSASPSDVAALAVKILDDINVSHPVVPGAFASNGQLFLPNRGGPINAQPGDYVAVDIQGYPFIIPKNSTTDSGNATTSWVHS